MLLSEFILCWFCDEWMLKHWDCKDKDLKERNWCFWAKKVKQKTVKFSIDELIPNCIKWRGSLYYVQHNKPKKRTLFTIYLYHIHWHSAHCKKYSLLFKSDFYLKSIYFEITAKLNIKKWDRSNEQKKGEKSNTMKLSQNNNYKN